MEIPNLSGGSVPPSPQLCLSARQKQPRTSLPSSRNSSSQPPAPPSILETASGRYTSVSSLWCIDNIVSTGSSYLSRFKLLRKMYQRRAHFRSFYGEYTEEGIDPDNLKEGIEFLGPPIDFWYTFPLQINQECERISVLEESEEATTAHSCWVECSRKMLDRDVGVGMLPTEDRLPFQWVANSSGTKFRSVKELVGLYNCNRIDGFMECIRCGGINGFGYRLPKRFKFVIKHLLENSGDFGTDKETVLTAGGFGCDCEGDEKPLSPIISENFRKINWLFLFCGVDLKHCTEEQLRFFCNQRKLPSSGNKKELIHHICQHLVHSFTSNSP